MERKKTVDRIKVLQSVNSLGMGGGTVIFVMNFFRHIDKERFQVDFVIYDGSKLDYDEEIKAAGSHIYVCESKSRSKIIRLFSEMIQVWKLLKKNHYDIIHCHANSFTQLFRGAVPGRHTKDTYVITHSHNPGEPRNTRFDNIFRKLLKSYVSRIADIGCACSDVAARGKYSEAFIQSAKYRFITNAINTKAYMYNENVRHKVRKELGISGTEFVIGHVGRMSYEKNDMFLLDIFKKFLNIRPDSKLLLVGDGELRKEIENKVREYDIESSVIFVGQCNNAARYYHTMDCFLLPSLFEGFPFVLVEAQVNGLHCLVSDVVPEIVNISGGVHFASLEDTAEGWAHKIKELCVSRMQYDDICGVIQQFDLNNEVKRLQNIYEEIMQKGDRDK